MRARLFLTFSGLAVVLAAACSASEAPPPADVPSRADAGPSANDASRIDAPATASDAPAGETGPSTPTVKDGVLVGGPGPMPGAIAGIAFKTGAQSGVTDSKGAYRYEEGGSITFSIAGVELATVPARATLSPFAFAGASCTVSDALKRALVAIETLDADGNIENGIALGSLTTPASESRKLATMSEADFDTWLTGLANGHAKADANAALTRMILRVGDETWSKTTEVTFDSVTSAARSQGVASDGTSFWFSWTLGLSRTDQSLGTQVNKTAAIPIDMLIAGSNHIGDIDVYGGTLYAPVEDGNKYENPTIVLYDAQTLDPKGPRFPLSNTMLTKGVPWIAVDGPKGNAYVAEWDPTPSIFELDLTTFATKRTITLSKTLGRIQGAKVVRDALYVASDDTDKTVYKVDLETGIVFPALFSYGASVIKELEGLAPVAGSGTDLSLRVLGVGAGGNSVTMFTHGRSRAPIRAEACAP